MTKWMTNITLISQHGKPGDCPICGGSNVKHGLIPFKGVDNRGWGGIWCDDCKVGYWISNAMLQDNYPIISKIPDGVRLE